MVLKIGSTQKELQTLLNQGFTCKLYKCPTRDEPGRILIQTCQTCPGALRDLKIGCGWSNGISVIPKTLKKRELNRGDLFPAIF